MMYLVRILFIISILYGPYTNADFSFKKIYSFVIPEKFEQTVYEEYQPQAATTLHINNKVGNISIVHDAHQRTIHCKAIKKSTKQEMVPLLTYEYKNTQNELTMRSTYNEKDITGSIDYELIVPTSLALQVQTKEGNITLKHAHKPSKLSTGKGSIVVDNAHAVCTAVCQGKGSVTVYNPHDYICAKTHNGSITIYHPHDAVTAQTNTGKIEMYAATIPSTASISLSTVAGPIFLHLPHDVNAQIQAYTERGTILSDHFITLKPQLTQLNKQAWKRLQRQIEGTIGTGEAHIKLSSVRSDIKLLEIKTAQG